MYKRVEGCRICKDTQFTAVLDLGMICPSDFVTDGDQSQKAPLTLVRCVNCGLVQLSCDVDRDSMYREYWYKSGLNKQMVAALRDVARGVRRRTLLEPNDVVIDIGCNDGTLLSFFPDWVYKIGFDPAKNLADKASKQCDRFINDYFEEYISTEGVTPRWVGHQRGQISWNQVPQADVITAIAVFYDLPDPRRFVEAVWKQLKPDGLFVLQFTDLVSMIETNAFDAVCHEHLEYYSLNVVCNLLRDCNFEVCDVEGNDVNGGSTRIYATRAFCSDVNPRVEAELRSESIFLNSEVLKGFKYRVECTKELVTDYVRSCEGDVAVLGASTKGNTLLQCFGLTHEDIDHAAEIDSDKFGMRTVGTNIPIIPQDESLRQNPECYLVLPWHFIEGFIASFTPYLKAGGKLLVPMPEVAVLTWEYGEVVWTFLRKDGSRNG